MNRTSSVVLLFFLALATTALASVNVSTPGNGAVLSSPFTLSASATSCSSQPVSSMGYSLDNSTNTTIVPSTSISAQIPASTGAHTLHVKAWGNQGAACDTDAAITITAAAATAPSTNSAATSGASNGISVSSPSNGAVVGTSFSLVAGAASCSSQPVSAMGYSLDSSTNTTVVNGTSVGATVTTSAGAHTLHVKAWGNGGASCDSDVAITAAATSGVVTSSGITVSSPYNGATVSSPFTLSASAASCSSQPVSAMGYSLDNSTNTSTFNETSLEASISATAGAHTLHVKAWGNGGAACGTDLAITASGTSAATTSMVPSGAVSVSSIQAMSNWQANFDASTGSGSASGTMSIVNSPSLSGQARDFATQFSNSGGELYHVSFGDDTASTNFYYDASVYFTNSSSQIANLEMDMNQTMSNGQTVIYGFQCDGYSSTWDYTKNGGSPANPSDQWVHSGAYCNPRDWSANAWHRVQVYYSRDGNGNVTYHSVSLDGQQENIEATVPSAFALGWGPVLLTNFQVDGLGSSGSPTVYLDNLTVTRW